jgi:hypothetical protein
MSACVKIPENVYDFLISYNGKVECILEAIDRHAFCLIFTLILTVLFLSSICQQQDVPMPVNVISVATVEISHNLVSQPVSEKPARKAPKQGRGC